MESSGRWFSLGVPARWGELFGRTVMTAAVTFVVLQLKEWFDANRFDTPATAVDALIIAAGTFVVYAILKWGKSSTGEPSPRAAARRGGYVVSPRPGTFGVRAAADVHVLPARPRHV